MGVKDGSGFLFLPLPASVLHLQTVCLLQLLDKAGGGTNELTNVGSTIDTSSSKAE